MVLTFCEIWFFYIWPVWLEIAYSRPFWGVFLRDMTGSPWNWEQAQGAKRLEFWGYQMVE